MTGDLNKSAGVKSAAFFDVDGTIIDTTIVHYFLYYKLRFTPRWKVRIWYPWFLAKCGVYLAMDKFNRGLLNSIFYRNYAGLSVAETKTAAADCVRHISDSKWLVGAREKMQEHRGAGQEIVLVTGSLDFLMESLAGVLGGGSVLAARLEERDGRFTGKLAGGPVIAEEKRRRMLEFAVRNRIEMKQCHAYGDSSADLSMLEAVGFPHAVNPDRKLRAIACKRDWPIHDWPVENAEKRNSWKRIEHCASHPHPVPLPEREREKHQ
jgi:HAD superfamily hydrolase (TIGR01490 family)